ncbi:MAG: 3-octaprenyl-4-hydroxybenzoate carboxy-lyase [Deltaproteobacteria bacterium]|nr:MAG: 3-octaprenyl-4-hydroxybenzoate carboxy-lyase [Deltaproteobacteria bacterium]
MPYASLNACVRDLEKNGHLRRIREPLDPVLEIPEIHRRVFENNGPALLFDQVKGSLFPAVSNLYGTLDRCRFIFRSTLADVQALIQAKADPVSLIKTPLALPGMMRSALCALPKQVTTGPAMTCTTRISALPRIQCWPDDGGPFILLPQVYSENPDRPGILRSNMGMYRVQLSGNDYVQDQEIGLHYQIRRDIGIHHGQAGKSRAPLRVSVFVGGPPAHAFAAVMPLPEGLPEVAFAGALAGRRFRFARKNGHVISTDADFVITGWIDPDATKPEGPFGDHVGYYSLTHPFPFIRVEAVYHRPDAIWPFTVVGRPPQEDTLFGKMIHEITGPMVPVSLPGVTAVHAVDAAGVHPLLLAKGRESYIPYQPRAPREILTLANSILGFGHCSLAKYLFICADEDAPDLDIHDIPAFFRHVLERVDWRRDLHFQTRTTIDTLDYTGEGLNQGSKVVIAAAGDPIRQLSTRIPPALFLPAGFTDPALVLPGILAITGPSVSDPETGQADLAALADALDAGDTLAGLPLVLLCDDSAFTARTVNNFLWVTFTRSNPSHDIHGAGAFTRFKHWGCTGPLIIDARQKPHHAPPLVTDPAVDRRVDALAKKGGPLEGLF